MAEALPTRYEVGNDAAGEGWAIVFIDDAGSLAVLSDFGNFAHRWPSNGWRQIDFRRFLLDVGAEYLVRKLCEGEREYRGDLTAVAVRDQLLQMRREHRRSPTSRAAIGPAAARCEWNLVAECGALATAADFERWCARTQLEEPRSMAVEGYPRAAQAFAERSWPRIRRALELDLAFEKLPADVEPASHTVTASAPAHAGALQ